MSSAVLVVNDDGIGARGLHTLIEHLKLLSDVNTYVVAPKEEWSAKGHAITIREPLYASRVKTFGVAAWRVSGSPADCVKLGLNALVDEPVDLVVAGINQGPNLATDVLYSGTVSAAIESVLAGIPALAVSLTKARRARGNFATAGQLAAVLVQQVLKDSWLAPPLLNINIPDIPAGEIKGISVTELGSCPYDDMVRMELDDSGNTRYWLAVRTLEDAAEKGTDLLAIKQGNVSITPLDFFNITDRGAMDRIQPLAQTLEEELPAGETSES